MIHIGVRSEYSFKNAFSPITEIVKLPGEAIGIADDDNTYGHIPFTKEALNAGKKPILGVRLTVAREIRERFKYGGFRVLFIARNKEGLKEMYKLVNTAWDNFYYTPKLSIEDLTGISDNILALNLNYAGKDKEILSSFYATGLNYSTPDALLGDSGVYVDDNAFIGVQDREVYELMAGSSKRGDGRSYSFSEEIYPQHVLSVDEIRAEFGHEAISMTDQVAGLCSADIEPADMVKYSGSNTVFGLCTKGAMKKNIDLDDEVYGDRLKFEMELISTKGYDDYFLITADMVSFAKRNGVLVGPSRGSSAGSLVCYLMDITEVDPIPYGLLFNRFIDINRHDLPDIDIDFPDTKREFVIKYLIKKYGKDKVASLANINRFKAKSAIGEFAQGLGIPPYETTAIKDSIIERSGGDARAAMCILDTLEGTDAGKEFIQKYPTMKLVANIEGHASHAGKHAAGIIVSTEPLTSYGGINSREGTIMMDKKDAEYVNLLKIDVLGLRTLAILEDACDLIRMPYNDLYRLELDDKKTFDIFNDVRLSGIFQFEGQALRILTKQMGVGEFNDIVSITALARPGALNSGGANRFVKYKTGVEDPIYRSDIHRRLTEETMGIIVYQEQMMSMAKEIGNFSWEDVSTLRKAASKSLGDEFFSKFKEKFIVGAKENGIGSEDAEALWGDIAATGSWTFNKCLSGDTKIIIASPGQNLKREMKISDLYEMYKVNPKSYTKTRMNKGIGPQLISLFPDGRCRPQHACDIIYNGKKQIVNYTFSDWTTISCTEDHKFLINGKWKAIGESNIGDEFTIGEYEKTKRVSTKENAGSGNVNNGKDNKGESNPAYANGVSIHLLEQQDIAREEECPCEDCSSSHNRLEVHHNDFDGGHTSPTDTAILCPSCHKKRHYANGRTARWGKGYTTSEVRLIGVELGEYEDTYDIEMPEHHNFLIEGGLVTHNSHAVSYALISYWTAWFKANHPLEFAVANLNHAKDSDSAVRFLRDLVENDGIEYVPIDPDTSQINWSVQDGKLVGGLMNIDGIGLSKARKIVSDRASGKVFTPAVFAKLMNPVTHFDILFPTKHYWGHFYDDPRSYGLHKSPALIKDISGKDSYILVGKVIERDLRDRNDYQSVVKRGGKKVDKDQYYLKLIVEDDTDSVLCMVSHTDFERLEGQHLSESLKPGETWVIIKGKIKSDWRMITIESITNLTDWSNT